MSFFDAPLLLDGGLGTHLEARGHDISGALWSARILREDPAEIEAAHADFFAAGAHVATTASYQVTFDALGEEAEVLLRRSVELARSAAASADAAFGDSPVGRRLVAASIGPYGAGPGEGTDYDGAYGLSRAELFRWHARRVDILARTDADFLLAETIPNVDEVAALLELLADQPKPFALSITGAIAESPDKLQRVVELANQSPRLGALGVNCVSATEALRVVRTLRSGTDIPLMAYPNSGETWDHRARTWRRDITDAPGLLETAPALREAGVSVLGGCCRVGPDLIRDVAYDF